eukprot:1487042-Lingulodinium_polyedra.AAC.1
MPDATGAAAEGLGRLQHDVGELRSLLTVGNSDVDGIQRVVLACERGVEGLAAAVAAVSADLGSMRAR